MSARRRTAPAFAGLAGAVVLLAACTEPGADACTNANRAITLGNLAGNSLSGSYDQCIADLQGELQGLRLEGRVLEGEAARLNAQSASLDGDRRAAAQRLAGLNAEQAAIMRRISEAGLSTNASDGQVRSVLAEEQRLRQEIAQQNQAGGVDPATSRRLAERQVRLNRLARQAL